MHVASEVVLKKIKHIILMIVFSVFKAFSRSSDQATVKKFCPETRAFKFRLNHGKETVTWLFKLLEKPEEQ